jgi:hypothetical protein
MNALCSPSQPTSRLKSVSKFFAATLVGALFCLGLGLASNAQACRDCPFPLKTGENTWLMPNGQLEVRIVESKVAGSGHLIQTTIQVYDASTHLLMAQGSIRGTPTGNTIYVSLRDMQGKPVTAEIQWVNGRRDQVRIELSCGQYNCSLEDMT